MSAAAAVLRDERLSDAEILASLGGEELYSAASETSARYEGLVVAAAIRIAMRRTGMNWGQMAEAMGVSKTTLYRFRRGALVEPATVKRMLTLVLFAMDSAMEGGR